MVARQSGAGIQKLTGVSGFNLIAPNFFHSVDSLNLVGYLNNILTLWSGIPILHCFWSLPLDYTLVLKVLLLKKLKIRNSDPYFSRYSSRTRIRCGKETCFYTRKISWNYSTDWLAYTRL